MFDPTSRYYRIGTAVFRARDGKDIVYKRRRMLPAVSALTVLGEAPVKHGDRLDLIAARTLGNPELFWRICDANNVLNPLEFLESAGPTVRIPKPEV
jgi:hypothetical protein